MSQPIPQQPKPAVKLLRRPRPPRQSRMKERTFETTELDLYSTTSSQCDANYMIHPDPVSRLSPVLSVHPDLITPPPSMEPRLLAKERRKIARPTPMVRRPPIAPWEKKFVLDPHYDSRSTTAAVSRGGVRTSLVKPYRPRGPDPLLPRQPRRNLAVMKEMMFDEREEEARLRRPPLFTLNNFIRSVSNSLNINIERVSKITFSSNTYKRITELIHQKMCPPNRRPPTIIDIDEETRGQFVEAENRLPAKQVLLEMTALIKQRIEQVTNTDISCQIRRLPKFDPRYRLGEAPHTEIVVMEDSHQQELERFVQFDHSYQHPARETLFSAGEERRFQDSRRGGEPFASDTDQISPAEVCVLDAVMNGGEALSLKGNFVHQLPDIAFLVRSLTYVNLSYNNFTVFPVELFLVKQLQVLKMRNNPLIALPIQIDQFQLLHTLVVSFCLLSDLPMTLYSLPELRVLDLSYNRLTSLHNKVAKLKRLIRLHVEGNELPALPAGVLRLKLRSIRVRNNFMHPLFWREHTVNSPLKLVHNAALIVRQACIDEKFAPYDPADMNVDKEYGSPLPTLPEAAVQVLLKRGVCDCCMGSMFGPGLKVIRPCKKIFGVKMIPILFNACSPYCLNSFKTSYNQIVSMLYGEEEEEGDNALAIVPVIENQETADSDEGVIE